MLLCHHRPSRLTDSRPVLVDGFSSGDRRRLKPIIQSLLSAPLPELASKALRAALCLLRSGTLHPLEDIALASCCTWPCGLQHSCFCDNRLLCLVPAFQANSLLLVWEEVLRWILNLLSCVLCLGPRLCTYLSQRLASLFALCIPYCAGGDRLLRPHSTAVSMPPACLPPSIQASRVKASYSLHPPAGENKPVSCGASAPICHPLHSMLALSFSTVWYLSFPWLLQLGSGLTTQSHVLALACSIILKVVSIPPHCHLFLMQRSFH